jgi:hypothetical protein
LNKRYYILLLLNIIFYSTVSFRINEIVVIVEADASNGGEEVVLSRFRHGGNFI